MDSKWAKQATKPLSGIQFSINGEHGGMAFDASANSEFDSALSPVWSATTVRATQPTIGQWQHNLTVTFHHKHCYMILKEQMQDPRSREAYLRCSLTIPPGIYTIGHSKYMPDGSYEILLILSSPTLRIDGSSIEQCNSKNPPVNGPPRRMKQELMSWKTRNALETATFLRVRVLRPTENRNLQSFVPKIEAILQAAHLPSLAEKVLEEKKAQNSILTADDEIVKEKLESWNVKNGLCEVIDAGSKDKQPLFKCTSPIVWEIESGTLVQLGAKVDTHPIHMSNEPRYKELDIWFGQIQPWTSTLLRSQRHVRILNECNDHWRSEFILGLNKPFSVDITAYEDDPMAARYVTALRNFLTAAQISHGEVLTDPPNKRSQIKLDTARLFVDDPRNNTQGWTSYPFKLRVPQNGIQYPAYWNKAVRRAFKSIQKGRGRISGCIGPPGCGKTTFMGDFMVEAQKQLVLPKGKIAAVAQTNTAVQQLVEKAGASMERSGVTESQDYICHVLAPGSRTAESKRGKITKQEREDEDPTARSPIAKYSIWEHCRRRATALGPEYEPWFVGDLEMRKHGEIGSRELYRTHRKLEQQLFAMIRKDCSVFCSTLANVSGGFFVPADDDEDGQFKIDILMVDEASQIILSHLLVAVQLFDPAQLFIAGDDKQLPAFCASNDPAIKAIAQYSPIARVEARGIKLPMLNEEHRTYQCLYGAVSKTFYKNEVTAAAHTIGTEGEKMFRRQLPRLEIWTGTQYVKLVNPGTIFNCVRGQQDKKEGSTSSFNAVEARLVKHLAAALVQAGYPPRKILQISAYKDQYNDMEANNMASLGGQCRVKTLDSAQGDDAGALILSTVVSGPPHSIGIMGDPRRINVFVSRQKRALFIVCNYTLLTTPAAELRAMGVKYGEIAGYQTWRTFLGHFEDDQRQAMYDLQVIGSSKIDIHTTEPHFRVDGVKVVPRDEITQPLFPPAPPTTINPPRDSPPPPSPVLPPHQKQEPMDISTLHPPEIEQAPPGSTIHISIPQAPQTAPTDEERSAVYAAMYAGRPRLVKKQLENVAEYIRDLVIPMGLGEEDLLEAAREGLRRQRADNL